LLWIVYVLAWPAAYMLGLLTGAKPLGWLMMLVAALIIPLQTMNGAAALRMWGAGVGLGGLAWLASTAGSLSPQLLEMMHSSNADRTLVPLMDLLLQVGGGGAVIAAVVASLSGSREQQAHVHVQALLLERAKVGHDINNHLAKAHLYGSYIQEDLAKVQDPQLQETQRLGKRLLGCLRDALAFLEELMGQAKDPLSHVPKMGVFYMSTCISDAINKACRTPEERERIQWDVMQFTYLVQGNKTRVTYGLANFIRNALDHTKPGDKVMINTEKDDPMYRVSVMDTGPGLVPRDVPLVFKAGHSRREGGHGFGLSSGKEGVVSSGGYAYAESVYGYGACFVVEILQATPQQVAAYKEARERKNQE
ncbi:MAG: HAMP domain-containing sensor histidine kinase, partial [Myxococcota bacterium]